MARATKKAINAELKKLGIDAEIVRGEGYYFLIGPGVDGWYQTGIYTYALGHMPLERWMDAIKAMRDDPKNRT